jgi:hypothetical protein
MRKGLVLTLVVALAFVASANATVLWDNNIVPNAVAARAISPPAFPNIRVVDDFTIPAGERWDIRDLHMNIIEDTGFVSGTTSELYIYADNNGPTGAPIHSSTTNFTKMATGASYFGRLDYEYWLEEISVQLGAGRYWIGTRNPGATGAGTNYWMTSDGGPDGMGTSTGYFSLNGGNTWTHEGDGWHHAFVITPEPTSALLLGLGAIALIRRRKQVTSLARLIRGSTRRLDE